MENEKPCYLQCQCNGVSQLIILIIVTIALQTFLDIQNAPSPSLFIQTALQYYVLSLIRMKAFQFQRLRLQIEITTAAQQNQ